jgi:hypothetical protein
MLGIEMRAIMGRQPTPPRSTAVAPAIASEEAFSDAYVAAKRSLSVLQGPVFKTLWKTLETPGSYQANFAAGPKTLQRYAKTAVRGGCTDHTTCLKLMLRCLRQPGVSPSTLALLGDTLSSSTPSLPLHENTVQLYKNIYENLASKQHLALYQGLLNVITRVWITHAPESLSAQSLCNMAYIQFTRQNKESATQAARLVLSGETSTTAQKAWVHNLLGVVHAQKAQCAKRPEDFAEHKRHALTWFEKGFSVPESLCAQNARLLEEIKLQKTMHIIGTRMYSLHTCDKAQTYTVPKPC